MGFEVGEAATPEEKEAVYRFRYSVYVEEMGRYQDTADHVGKRLLEPEDETSWIFHAKEDGNVVGTARLSWGARGFSQRQIDEYSLEPFLAEVPHEHLAIGERVMVTPRLRGTGLVDQLWRDYKHARGLSGDRERLRYYEGLLRGFLQKLADQQARLVAEHALVPVRDAKLHEFFHWHHPRVRTTLTAGVAPSRAYQDGKRTGRGIDIRRPLATRGDGVRGLLP